MRHRLIDSITLRAGTLLMLVLGFVRPVYCDQQPVPFFEQSDAEYESWIATAREYLATHPEHVYAPRLANDIRILAQANKDASLSREMARIMLLKYPSSPFSQAHFKSLDEDRFKELVDDAIRHVPTGASTEYFSAIRDLADMGIRQWGSDFLGSAHWLSLAISTHVLGDHTLHAVARQHLKDGDRTEHEILGIVTDTGRGLRETLEDLIPFTAIPVVRRYQAYLADQLKDDPDPSHLVDRIVAIHHVYQSELREARDRIANVPEWQNDAQMAFLHILCRAGLQELSELDEECKVLVSKHGDGEWSRIAGEIQKAVRDFDFNVLAVADKVQALAISLLRGDAECMEAHVLMNDTIQVYFALDRVNRNAEFQLSDNQGMVIAIKRHGATVSWFSRTNGFQIYTYAMTQDESDRIQKLSPVISFDEGPDEYRISASLGSGEAVLPPHFIAKVLEVIRPMNIRRVMTRLRDKGTYVLVEDLPDEALKIRMLTPIPHSVTPSEAELIFKASERVVFARAGQFEIKRLAYGKNEDFEYHNLPWPDAPHQRLDQPPVQQLFAVAGSIVSFLSEQAKKSDVESLRRQLTEIDHISDSRAD